MQSTVEGLAQQVKDLMPKGKTVAVAESLTAGLIQAALASVSGSSEFFVGGITTYNLEQKVQLLGVDRESAAKVNCVSRVVAHQMAEGVGKLFGADITVSTTGYAEPWPAGNVLHPHAFIAVRWDDKTAIYTLIGEASRESRNVFREKVTVAALNAIVCALFHKDSNGQAR